jgi:hypothetical protein
MQEMLRRKAEEMEGSAARLKTRIQQEAQLLSEGLTGTRLIVAEASR